MKSTKYEPLKRHLEGMFQHGEVRLSFAEIERILGFSLPPSAYEAQPWWSNTRAGHSQAAAWLDAGWKTATLDLGGRQVSFVKADDKPDGVAEESAPFLRDDPAVVAFPLDALGERAVRMIDAHVEAHGGDRTNACVALLNQLANDRLVAMVEWFQKASPPLPADVDVVDLIREDRDSDER
jgi:hypothetical protein